MFVIFFDGAASPPGPTSTVTFIIDGANQTSAVQLNQFSIDMTLGSDWVATINVFDTDSTLSAYRPSLDQAVSIADGSTTLFHGTVTRVEDRPLAEPHIGTQTTITARATSQIVDQILVNKTYAAGQTLHAVVSDLHTTYMVPYGITLDATMATGATLELQTFADVTLRDVFTHLSEITGWVWRITPSDELQWFAAGTKSASYSLTAANRQNTGAVTWDKTRQQYVNSVRVRYGTESNVPKVWTTTGDGILSSWVLDYDSARNTDDYILSAGYVTDNGVFSPLSPFGGSTNWQFGSGTNALYRTSGPLGVGEVATFAYDAKFPQVVTVEDAAEIAANGRFEAVFEAPDIFDKTAATELATGLLRRSLAVPQWVRVSTRQGFVMPGDQITLTFADRLISGAHLVTQVKARSIAAGQMIYDLTCLSGAELQQTWADQLKASLGGRSSSSGGTISGSVVPNVSGSFDGDIVASTGILADESSLRKSATGGLTNSSTTGPGLLLGRPDAAWAWGLVANYLHLSNGADGGSGRRSLCVMYCPEATGSGGTAMELSKDDANTPNVYYLTCPPSTTLNLGSPGPSTINNGSKVNAVYGNGFTFTSGVGQVTGTRPEVRLFDLSGSRFGRLVVLTSSQMAMTQNLVYSGSGVDFTLDDTSKSGWLARLIDSGQTDTFTISRASAGANPRTVTDLLTLYSSGLLAVTGGYLERGRTTPMGEWIAVAFSAGNFTGSGSMTWTVEVGDQVTYRYTLNGKTMTLSFWINATSVGGTPDTQLRIAIPGGFTAAQSMSGVCKIVDNGTPEFAEWAVSAAGSTVNIGRNTGGNFTASTNNTYARGTAIFEVN